MGSFDTRLLEELWLLSSVSPDLPGKWLWGVATIAMWLERYFRASGWTGGKGSPGSGRLDHNGPMKMLNVLHRRFARWLLAAWLGLQVLQARAAEAPFQAGELRRFITNSAPFLEWVRTNGPTNVLERLMKNPKAVTEYPEAVRLLREGGWEPDRFAYILNHVLTAYQRLGMGRDPNQLLARLEESKVAVRKDFTQSEAEKARTLSLVEQAQREVRRTDKAFAGLPAEEVRLLWLHREELRRALDGRLPMKKCELPNVSGKP